MSCSKWPRLSTIVALAASGTLVFAPEAESQQNCAVTNPLDCSASWLVRQISPSANLFSDTFGRACVRHDYCYRTGFSTYGYTKDQCDRMFKSDMERRCDN